MNKILIFVFVFLCGKLLCALQIRNASMLSYSGVYIVLSDSTIGTDVSGKITATNCLNGRLFKSGTKINIGNAFDQTKYYDLIFVDTSEFSKTGSNKVAIKYSILFSEKQIAIRDIDIFIDGSLASPSKPLDVYSDLLFTIKNTGKTRLVRAEISLNDTLHFIPLAGFIPWVPLQPGVEKIFFQRDFMPRNSSKKSYIKCWTEYRGVVESTTTYLSPSLSSSIVLTVTDRVISADKYVKPRYSDGGGGEGSPYPTNGSARPNTDSEK